MKALQSTLAFLLVSSAFFAASANAAQILDRVLVVIGDKAILESDLDKTMADIKKTPALAAAYRIDPKDIDSTKLLERLIEEKIIQQVVKEKGLEVPDTDVDKQINSIALQNHLSKDELRRSLLGEGIPFDVYKTNIKAQLERRNLFDRELRAGGGVSEQELRTLYDRKADLEMDLHLITLKKSPANKAKLEEIVGQVKAGKINPVQALEQVPHHDMGWMKSGELNASLKKTVGTLNGAGAAGPVADGSNLQAVVVTATRKGNEEEFVQVKDSLMNQAQGEDFEKRFAIWLERKKDEMQILRNKI